MERIKKLNSYQIGILIIMLTMSLIFAVIYPKIISRVGYRYQDTFLALTEGNGNTVYSGKIQGEQAEFIVSDDNTVVFNYGDKTYGPYTVKQDVTAIPKDNEMSDNMTGIEIREGNDILFRGGVIDFGSFNQFYNEDGTSDSVLVSYTTADGMEWDENGNPFDSMKPSISTIYELTNNPELTHKGVSFAWFVAVFISIINALSILFVDELFRFHLAFQIRNVDHAEPSDWELSKRYIGWTVVTIMVLVIYIMGLQ